MFSVELIPDDEIDRVVREDWDRLLGADLPSSGRNPAPSNRPHVTLAVREHLEPPAFAGIAEMLPVPLELGGVLLLGHRDRYVLTRQVVVTSALLEIHRVVAEASGNPFLRAADPSPATRPRASTTGRRTSPSRAG